MIDIARRYCLGAGIGIFGYALMIELVPTATDVILCLLNPGFGVGAAIEHGVKGGMAFEANFGLVASSS